MCFGIGWCTFMICISLILSSISVMKAWPPQIDLFIYLTDMSYVHITGFNLRIFGFEMNITGRCISEDILLPEEFCSVNVVIVLVLYSFEESLANLSRK